MEGGGAQPAAAALGEVFRQLRALSEHLGDEIVVAAAVPRGDGPAPGRAGRGEAPRPARAAGTGAAGPAGDRSAARPGAAWPRGTPAGAAELLVLVDDNLVALAPDRADLRAVLSGGGSPGPRSASAWPSATGMAPVCCSPPTWGPSPAAPPARPTPKGAARSELLQLGASDARYLVVEQEQLDDSTQNRATVSFAGPRTGVASWLAAPAPMGALDFVTPGASFAAAFVVKEPALVLDDLLRLVETLNPEMRRELARLEARTGVQLRADLAATLGNDLVVAIDGPLLPMPSWKLVMEVQDPERLAHSLEKLVAELNRVTSAAGRPGLTWQRQGTASAVKSAAVAASDTFVLRAPGTPVRGAPGCSSTATWWWPPTSRCCTGRCAPGRAGRCCAAPGASSSCCRPTARRTSRRSCTTTWVRRRRRWRAGWAGSGALQSEQQQGLDRLVREAKPGLFYVYGEAARTSRWPAPEASSG